MFYVDAAAFTYEDSGLKQVGPLQLTKPHSPLPFFFPFPFPFLLP
jgi:hypothetical protein